MRPGAFRGRTTLTRVVDIVVVLERVISTVALLVLVFILAFILWFPVQMPRNLAVFSVGFIVYFAAITGLLLAQSFLVAWDFEWNQRCYCNGSHRLLCVLGYLHYCGR